MSTQCRFGKESWKHFTQDDLVQIQRERAENEVKLREMLSRFPMNTFQYGKVCPACTKPNNKDTPFCTGCGFELTSSDIQKLPDNVFMDIITGVNKDTKIEYEDEEILVFNDKFGVSVYGEHVDVIPRHAIDDITCLTGDDIPLIKKLYEAGLKHLESRGFCERMGIPKEELPQWIIAGYNYPVSVKHLHLHMVLPPFKHEKVFQYPRWHSHNKVLSDLETHGRVIVYDEAPNDDQGKREYERAMSNHQKALSILN
jgi:diadenosine tetraphosphate (Ap4A) HIT family hydrolase